MGKNDGKIMEERNRDEKNDGNKMTRRGTKEPMRCSMTRELHELRHILLKQILGLALTTHLVETNSGFGSEKKNMSKQPTGLGGRQQHLQSLRCLDAIWPPACERQVVLLPGPAEALNWEAEGVVG